MSGQLDGLLTDSAMVRLRAVLEDRPDALLSLTAPDLTVLWAATRGAEGLYERGPAEFEGASTREFVHPDDLGRWEAAVEHALSGAATGFQGRAMHRDGRWVPVRSYLWATRHRDAVVSITVVDGDGD